MSYFRNNLMEIGVVVYGIALSNFTLYYIISDNFKCTQNILKIEHDIKIKKLEETIAIISQSNKNLQ
jgi:hypothetical protein